MAAHQEYVPTHVAEGAVLSPTGTSLSYDKTQFHQILFGGDQLSVARSRSTKILRCTHDKATDRLEGLVPVPEDWHTRMTFMKVSTITLHGQDASR